MIGIDLGKMKWRRKLYIDHIGVFLCLMCFVLLLSIMVVYFAANLMFTFFLLPNALAGTFTLSLISCYS